MFTHSKTLKASSPFFKHHLRQFTSSLNQQNLNDPISNMECSSIILGQAHHTQKPLLEDLPSEIKVMILCQIPQLSSLSSIVHASPTFHQAYRGAREEVLHTLVIRTLQKHDIGLLDPWTAIHAPPLGYHVPPGDVNNGEEFLERYAQGRIDNGRRRLAPMDSLAILSLQRKLTFLIAKYCLDKTSTNPLTPSSANDALPPSQSELHRLHRAFWRYEVYSKFFGPRKHEYGASPAYSTYGEVEIADSFFRLFPIHEVEEMACLHKWIRDYYFHDPAMCVWHGNQLVALGPQKLYGMITAGSERERKTCTAEYSNSRPIATMRDALDAYEREVSRGTWLWRDVCDFDESSRERIPTTGWLWASSLGIQNTNFRLRRWGYVFWDRARLDGWGITETDMVEWPEIFGPACGWLGSHPHNKIPNYHEGS